MPAEARPFVRFDMVRNVAWGCGIIVIFAMLTYCSRVIIRRANWTWSFFIVTSSESESHIADSEVDQPPGKLHTFASKLQDLFLDVKVCQQRHM